jgi:GH25 family lysozyme M1 (1,4-beta-N-acetylmuramidase)
MRDGTCLVIDVWEGQLEIDERVLKDAGVAGIGIRLNDMNGGHHMDENFLSQWGQAADFVRFPYFVYNPWVSGQENFNWLIVNCPPGVLCLAVDVEVRKAGYSAAIYAAEFKKFCDLAAANWRLIVYTAQWFLPYLSQWPVDLNYWWAQYPDPGLYLGDVQTWEDLEDRLDGLYMPFNVQSVPGRLKMWQFSGDYLRLPGTSKPVDANLFYGTVEDLQDFFGTGPDVEPPVPVVSSGLYGFDPVNYYARLGGGPLVLPMSRVRGKPDNMSRYQWSLLAPALANLNKTNPAALGLISRPDWGPSKGLDGNYIKWIGLIWPDRNVVKIAEIVDGYGRIDGVPVSWAIGLSADNDPHLVHMVYDFNKSAGYGERAKPVYVPILGGPWWVALKFLIRLDDLLPRVVKVNAFPWLNIRTAPAEAAPKVGQVLYLGSAKVTQITTGPGGIWGFVGSGWIALRNRGKNYTDWRI